MANLQGMMKVSFIAVLITAATPGICAGEDDVKEWFETGVKHLQNQEYAEAQEYLLRASEARPDIPQIYNALGLAYMQQKETVDAAIDAFEKAVETDPGYADAYNNLGIVYSEGVLDSELAEEYYRLAIEKDPKHSRAYFGLGWLYLMRQNFPDKAQEYFEKAIEYDPEHMEAQYFLGLSYILSGKKPQALKPISILRSRNRHESAMMLESAMNGDSQSVGTETGVGKAETLQSLEA